MPLFEYKCKDCGKRFEKLILGNRDVDLICPECGSEKTERQLSTFATTSGNGKCSSSGRFT